MNTIKQKVLVTAIIIENNKVLMQKRSDSIDTHRNKWTTPSGIVEINEDPRAAIIREVKEELDINIKILSLIPVIDSFPNHKNKYHLIYLSFLCEIVSGHVKNIDTEQDILDVQWFRVNELSKLDMVRGTLPPIQYVLKTSK
jgi:8-oxo-dGTP diphosphatase